MNLLFLKTNDYDTVLFWGDFNFKHSSWGDRTDSRGRLLHRLVLRNHLEILTHFSQYICGDIRDIPYQDVGERLRDVMFTECTTGWRRDSRGEFTRACFLIGIIAPSPESCTLAEQLHYIIRYALEMLD